MIEGLRDLALHIAPELGAQPFYIVDHVAAGLPAAGAGGFGIRRLPSNVFQLSEWHGPGSLIALDIEGLSRVVRQPEGELPYIRAVLIHELGHILPAMSSTEIAEYDSCEYDPPEEIKNAMQREMQIDADRLPGVVAEHGADWMRRVIHLWVRATVAGCDIRPRDIVGYQWLSSPEFYMPVLLGEAIRMQHVSFAEIDAMPMPEHAVQLSVRDAKQYRYYFPRENHAA